MMAAGEDQNAQKQCTLDTCPKDIRNICIQQCGKKHAEPMGLKLKWKLPMAKKEYKAPAGATITFEWTGDHNVYRMVSKEAYEKCDFAGAIDLGGSSPVKDVFRGDVAYYA